MNHGLILTFPDPLGPRKGSSVLIHQRSYPNPPPRRAFQNHFRQQTSIGDRYVCDEGNHGRTVGVYKKENCKIITQMLHGTHISTYISPKCMVNVGEYSCNFVPFYPKIICPPHQLSQVSPPPPKTKKKKLTRFFGNQTRPDVFPHQHGNHQCNGAKGTNWIHQLGPTFKLSVHKAFLFVFTERGTTDGRTEVRGEHREGTGRCFAKEGVADSRGEKRPGNLTPSI